MKLLPSLRARSWGDGDILVESVRGIDEAGPGEITFIANAQYEKKLQTTKASAILVSRDTECPGKNLIQVDDPYVALGKLLALFYPEETESPGISAQAMIEEGVEISPSAVVYPGVYVGRGARIDSGVVLYPGVFIGREVVVGRTLCSTRMSVSIGAVSLAGGSSSMPVPWWEAMGSVLPIRGGTI